MNEESSEPLEIEALIRAHLDRQAERVDPRPLFARIRQVPPVAPARTPGRRSVGWAFALAAGVLLALLWGLQLGPAQANGEQLVRAARAVHALPVDRCYLVEVRREPGLWGDLPKGPDQTRTTLLWTRGDRFWIESTNPWERWAWGRDEQGAVWASAGPFRGLRLEPDEVPPMMNTMCDVNSMRLQTLLTEVLRDFQVQREEPSPEALPNTELVNAEIRPGRFHPLMRRVQLEIDAETRVVRRVVIFRQRWDGQPLATTTYSLVETRPQDDARYTLEGHLREPREILTRSNLPERRFELVKRIFGPMAEKWLRLNRAEPAPAEKSEK